MTDERFYVLATVVDPRYLGRLFGAPTLASAKQWLLEECSAAAAEGDVEAAEEQTGPPARRQRVDEASEQNSVKAEIDRFVSMTPVDRSKFATACDWWCHNHHLYPNVASVAKRYLCAPTGAIGWRQRKQICYCLLSITWH